MEIPVCAIPGGFSSPPSLPLSFWSAPAYLKRRDILDKEPPVHPKPLETGVDGRANDWQHTVFKGDKKHFTIRARNIREIKEPSLMELEGVDLQLFRDDGAKVGPDPLREGAVRYRSQDALFRRRGRHHHGRAGGPGAYRPPVAHPRFRNAVCERYGQGHYGPARHVWIRPRQRLGRRRRIRSQHSRAAAAQQGRRSTGAAKLPTPSPCMSKRIRPSITSAIRKWSCTRSRNSPATRCTWKPAGAMSSSIKGAIRSAKVLMARGVHDDPGRKVEYAADELNMDFDDGMVIRTIEGHDHAQLISTSATARTTVNSDRLDMDFETADKESTLTTAVATGKSVAEATPLPRAGVPTRRHARSAQRRDPPGHAARRQGDRARGNRRSGQARVPAQPAGSAQTVHAGRSHLDGLRHGEPHPVGALDQRVHAYGAARESAQDRRRP